MSEPLVKLAGIGTDEAAWAGMPEGAVMLSDATTIGAMADDILARAPPRFALAGHSMGGYVALAIMARAPERIARLALISTSALPDSEEQRARRLQTIADARGDFPKVAAMLGRAMLSRASQANAALVAEASAMVLRCGEAAFLRQQRATLDRPDARPVLAAIAVPTLVIVGEDDRIVDPARSAELASAIAGSTLLRLPGVGHLPQREAPGAVHAALLDWQLGIKRPVAPRP